MKDRHQYRLVKNGKVAVLLACGPTPWSTWGDSKNEQLSMAYCPEIALLVINNASTKVIEEKAEELFRRLGNNLDRKLRVEWVPIGAHFYIIDALHEGEKIEYPDPDIDALTA